jgi:SAM-dependent methyltransferase
MSEAAERARATWSAGNWDAVSEILPPAGRRVLDIAGVEPGMDVVDVGCGSGGTVAIPAAQRGARVVGVDVTPELFDDARRRADAAGVEVEWVQGDAAELPLPDAAFDRVLSTFGHAFAADQEGAARELVRVCRPGGSIVAAMWTPEGANGQMFRVVGSHMPAPPPGFQPPVLWGTEARWEELVGGQGIELEFRRELLAIDWPADSDRTYMEFFEANFGPLVMARKLLGEEGWPALRADLEALFEETSTATDGGTHIEAEYLVAIGRKP